MPFNFFNTITIYTKFKKQATKYEKISVKTHAKIFIFGIFNKKYDKINFNMALNIPLNSVILVLERAINTAEEVCINDKKKTEKEAIFNILTIIIFSFSSSEEYNTLTTIGEKKYNKIAKNSPDATVKKTVNFTFLFTQILFAISGI